MLVQLFSNFTMKGLRHAISIYQNVSEEFSECFDCSGSNDYNTRQN